MEDYDTKDWGKSVDWAVDYMARVARDIYIQNQMRELANIRNNRLLTQ